MTLFLKLVAAVQGLAEIANDPATVALIAKLREWFESLPKLAQLAYASKFEPFLGYGCANCDDIDCPECPDDCKPIEALLIEAAKAGE